MNMLNERVDGWKDKGSSDEAAQGITISQKHCVGLQFERYGFMNHSLDWMKPFTESIASIAPRIRTMFIYFLLAVLLIVNVVPHIESVCSIHLTDLIN